MTGVLQGLAELFGEVGWSGEAVKLIGAELQAGGFELVDEGIRTLWVPDAEAVEACEEYGKSFIGKL